MMNKTTLFAAACALTFAVPLVAADSYGGFFLGPGNPSTSVIASPIETLFPCDPGAATQGVEGYWFDLSTESAGAPYTMSVDPTLDADLVWYDAGCNYLSYTGNGLVGEPETGNLPASASWVYVVDYVGAGAFTLDVI